MKFRSFIWISGFALIILVLVQYYFISETFQTKQQQFDSKYSSLAKLGLFDFENRFFDVTEDSVLYILDDFAYFAMHDVDFNNEYQKDSLYSLISKDFRIQLEKVNSKYLFLKEYFKTNGEEGEFTSGYLLNEITFLTLENEVTIFSDSSLHTDVESNGYVINSYTDERNYYRIKYDYYISFTHRSEQISREMLLTKTLSFVTLLIVFSVFFLTLRNLLIHKRLSDLKTDFINNMTHELKTPLSTISVASSSLALSDNQLSRERIVEISGIIKKQNKHLSRLIDRILDISIWEKDQVRIERKPIQLYNFISDVVDDFSSIHPSVKIELHRESEQENTLFPIDDVHFTTVLNNLLSNAVKYGSDDPKIDVWAACEQGVVLTIKDNGPGISKEEQKHIFDKFFRGKDTKKKAIRGLGLGLYYVRQIVEAHGGTITLDSSNAKGTVFIIEIPK
jgi:two-component system phosphate regulon sensor histidine kinase PhoR